MKKEIYNKQFNDLWEHWIYLSDIKVGVNFNHFRDGVKESIWNLFYTDKGEMDQKINQIMWILKDVVEVIDEKKSWGFDMSEESKAKMKEFLVNPDIFVNKNF